MKKQYLTEWKNIGIFKLDKNRSVNHQEQEQSFFGVNQTNKKNLVCESKNLTLIKRTETYIFTQPQHRVGSGDHPYFKKKKKNDTLIIHWLPPSPKTNRAMCPVFVLMMMKK